MRLSTKMRVATTIIALLAWPTSACAANAGPALVGIPMEFVLFALTLLGVALFQRHTLWAALVGLVAIALYKLTFTGFKTGTGIAGLGAHLTQESVILANLLGLLLGFALLSRHFELSGVPNKLARYLPHGWKGAFALLAMIFVLSAFLDNIAAALIGGTVAADIYRRRLHLGYLAAIVAASNAGGSGSVVGDTTTTMMWISGVGALDVLHAYAAALVALIVFGIPASLQQHRLASIDRASAKHAHVDRMRAGIVVFVLVVAVTTNVVVNFAGEEIAEQFPFLGAAVWVALLLAAPWRKPQWSLLPDAFKGSVFLLALVVCASLMPVETLPIASWQTTLGLGFVSAVFDNIPLTALALKQGGYDWGFLAYAVGFGGSMIWFGSSAGVALAGLFPQAKSVGAWLRHGWHVALAYVIGFFVMLGVLGWQPHAPHNRSPVQPTVLSVPAAMDK